VPDRFTHDAIAHVPRAEAWAALQRPEVWENIAGVQRVTNPRHDPAGLLAGYTFTVQAGPSTFRATAKTTIATPPEKMVLAIDSSEIKGTLTAMLANISERSTRVSVTVEIRAKGLLAQMFYPVVAQTVRTGLPSQVQAFAFKLSAPADGADGSDGIGDASEPA
jgi:carbon monoxide dehydrogenase subunit G